MRYFPIKALLTIILPAVITGCGTTHKIKFNDFTEAYKQSNYCKAADIALGEGEICKTIAEDIDPDDFNIDEQLNGGTALFLAQKPDLSNKIFEGAAKEIQEKLEATGVGRSTVEVLANASLVDYNPMIMDGIYLHSYTLLNALAQNNKDEAKIQVNRVHSVQQKAVEEFSKEIQKQNEKNAEDIAEMQQEVKASNQQNISQVIDNYKEFERFNGYANFVNPYVTYMSGLFFMTNANSNSDYETASNYLKRVSGMVNNTFVKQDLDLANKLASGTQKKVSPTTWVIFENGLVANFEEFRLDLPIFVATNNVKTASLALPYPQEREIAYNNISVSNGKKKVNTQLLANIDNIFIAEFNKKMPVIISKAVTKLTLQTVAQAAMQKELGDLGGIAMSVYSIITTSADTRSWYSLPKNVQLAKIDKRGTDLTLNIGDQEYKVEVSKEGNSIVYVRVPATGAIPAINVLNL